MEQENRQEKKARLIAFYLPQYHPIPENNEWWGKGFTEWTNSSKARPMFKGHYQPHVPADLGYYDLRLPEMRMAQAEMAKTYGIEGFCYWHYWFGNGKRLLELPFNEVLKSGKPDFPFCLAWANQTWSGIWHGCPNKILIEQKYPGEADYEAHFYSLLDAFFDKRYIKIDDKPVFMLQDVNKFLDHKIFAECWNKLAIRAGFKGMHLMGNTFPSWTPSEHGFDANVNNSFLYAEKQISKKFRYRVTKLVEDLTGVDIYYSYGRIFNKPTIYSYEEFIKYMDIPLREDIVQYPCIYPNWDNTPRSGHRGFVLRDSTPELFRTHLKKAIAKVSYRDYDKRFVFIKSWNEWAEGNHLEPDLKYGKAYLEVIRQELTLTTDSVHHYSSI
jgi:hypothetical protein